VARLPADFPEQFPSPEPPPLLLIAHRKEILLQALATFRQVLRDPSFGELYVDGEMPSQWRHVFASVQSLANRSLAEIPAERFKVVIVDEFHHTAASSYRRCSASPPPPNGLLAWQKGGLDILHWFGGRIATELRLWSALDQGLLAPFHYFAVADATDLSALEWRRGGYVPSQLSAVYTGDHRRVDLILSELHNTVADPARMRALGFCVSVEQACSPGRPAPSAIRRAADPLRRRPLQRRARHPRDRHRAALAAHRERGGVSAAAGPGPAPLARHRQELPHRSRLHRPAAPAFSF
jgi:superfamily II DNA or RNA helicase